MKKYFMTALALLCFTTVSKAQNAENADSLRMEELQEVVVKAVRVQKNAPFAVANIKKDELPILLRAVYTVNSPSFSHAPPA